jgi:hypothetical protein
MRSRRDHRHYLEAGDAYALCRLAGMARRDVHKLAAPAAAG